MIYFDNAATTRVKPDCVIRAVVDAMQNSGNSGRGGHGASLAAGRKIYGVRVQLAEFFGASDPSRVIFTSNATEALNTAIRGLLRPGDHVITTCLEHNSVLRPLYDLSHPSSEEEAQSSAEVEVDYVGCDPLGYPRYEEFESRIRPNTRAIICTHASNLTGNLVDLAGVSAVAKKHGLIFVVDASQTAGVFPISMEEMGIDILCFTGHKSLLGPQGTGGLILGPDVELRPLKSGGTGVKTYHPTQPEEYPEHLEAGTLNSHGIAGLGAALSYIQETGIDTIRERELTLMRRFYEGIREIPGVKVLGDADAVLRAPIISLNLADWDSGEVADALFEEYEICTRPGGHCAPRMHEELGTREQGAVRFSFSHSNTVDEVDRAIEALRELAEDA